ncbi:hypothetical protein PAAG_01920 [Paracoccidioides lutzii Pb01]|uniref:Uncharacterized protein n=1 Tax=Paracoccidioides lutzii (strain ATCC MYA-826 / Pb01) TaxID=502779 RepID=C1GTS5_PARBA|nr:hypothetical protein PAAG_01920 [Paracoccidioides lutzii Pb01]EEH39731.2 hypothetical protein PAAG_01920 [Paracoccidioides lutzii Pb01]
MKAIDAYFFGASIAAESAPSHLDIRDLKTYQQLFTYIIPLISHLGFINIAVVLVRLRWFRRRVNKISAMVYQVAPSEAQRRLDVETHAYKFPEDEGKGAVLVEEAGPISDSFGGGKRQSTTPNVESTGSNTNANDTNEVPDQNVNPHHTSISFAPDVRGYDKSKALHVPPPHERERERPIVKVDQVFSGDEEIVKSNDVSIGRSLSASRRLKSRSSSVQCQHSRKGCFIHLCARREV